MSHIVHSGSVTECGGANPRHVPLPATYEITFSPFDADRVGNLGNGIAPKETLAGAAAVVGQLITSIGASDIITSSLVAWGGWGALIVPSCTLRVRAAKDQALEVASVLAKTQGQILVTASPGTVRALDVVFKDGHSVGDPVFLGRFWADCQWQSRNALSGFTALRRRQADAIRIIDLDSSWPALPETCRWVLVAARSAGAYVLVEERLLATTTVGVPRSPELPGAEPLRRGRELVLADTWKRAGSRRCGSSRRHHSGRGKRLVSASSVATELSGASEPGAEASS